MRVSGWYVIALGAVLGLPRLVNADETVHLNLGGPREVNVQVSIAPSSYSILVQMLPVKAFDRATNAALNREKARSYALQGLERYLSGQTSELTVSGAEIKKAGIHGRYYTLSLWVPGKGVKMIAHGRERPENRAKQTTPMEGGASSDLLTRKSDYVNTLDQLAKRNRVEVESLKRFGKRDSEDFFRRVSEIEEAGEKNLALIKAEVEQDNLLLTVEKEALVVSVRKDRGSLLAELKQTVKSFEARIKEKQ